MTSVHIPSGIKVGDMKKFLEGKDDNLKVRVRVENKDMDPVVSQVSKESFWVTIHTREALVVDELPAEEGYDA